MDPDKFLCAVCGQEFEKGRTDEEAVAEMQRRFPGFTKEQCATVCSDCVIRTVPPK